MKYFIVLSGEKKCFTLNFSTHNSPNMKKDAYEFYKKFKSIFNEMYFDLKNSKFDFHFFRQVAC